MMNFHQNEASNYPLTTQKNNKKIITAKFKKKNEKEDIFLN